MKKHCFAFILLFIVIVSGYAQPAALNYTIAPWFNNKKAAVSLTLDDGISGQFTIAVPMLNQHNFKATFFITTKTLISQLGDWHLVQQAAGEGHEIANHALTHPHFNAISKEEITTELIESNALIDKNIPSQKTITHAYPYGEGGNETPPEIAARNVVKNYFIGARATRIKALTYNPYNFAQSDDDYFKVNSDIIADSASMADFGLQLDKAISAGGWYVPTYHGIENGWIITPKNIFENHLNELEKRKEDLWIATFADVLKYHKERNCAKLVSLSENKHSLILQLTDTLANHTIWNQPLTINLKTDGRKIKNIQQSGNNILFSTLQDEIIFNAVPGNDKIIIHKTD